MSFRRGIKVIKARSASELDAMEAAGHIVGEALSRIRREATAGMTAKDLDRIAEETIRSHGAIPTFLGYGGFPATICCSINDVVVHGIPREDTVLQEGDLVSIDCGATLDGWVGDSALTFGVGEISDSAQRLSDATRYVLTQGIAAMVPGNRLTDVSHALEQATRKAETMFGQSLFILDGYGGHGIGRKMHEEPYLANEGAPGRGPLIQEGSVLAIEPMLTLGTVDSDTLPDKWTVVTVDGSLAAHWEHTVAATSNGPRILTAREDD